MVSDIFERYAVVGELALEGNMRPVKGALSMAMAVTGPMATSFLEEIAPGSPPRSSTACLMPEGLVKMAVSTPSMALRKSSRLAPLGRIVS